MKKSQRFDVEIFPIFGKPAATVEPRDRAFDNPAFRQDDKTFGLIAASDDFDLKLWQDFNQCSLENRAAVAAVGKKLF